MRSPVAVVPFLLGAVLTLALAPAAHGLVRPDDRDFNGDGFNDLVIGIPNESVGTLGGAGAVAVSGASETVQQWTQDSPGVQNAAEAGDGFGVSFTSGDFDGDGFDDLAVGAPGEDFGSGANNGAVHVLYGTAAGLSSARNQLWHQDSTGILDLNETGERFGGRLAAGDLNFDGYADLVVSAWGENDFAGAVHVILGSPSGLAAAANQLFDQNSPGVPEAREAGDVFGAALTVADFNNDVYHDIAVGSSGEDLGDVPNAGTVHILRGSASGITGTGSQLWHQDSPAIEESNEPDDGFGTVLASGDMNGDGFDDVAIGSPNEEEDFGSNWHWGGVAVLYGAAAGLTAANDQVFNHNGPEPGRSGSGIGVADIDGDGFDDVAFGDPNAERYPPDNNTGVFGGGLVEVRYGASSGGVGSRRIEVWDQEGPAMLATAGREEGVRNQDGREYFGASVYGGRRRSDSPQGVLLVAVPGEDVGPRFPDAGAVRVFYSSPVGLGASDFRSVGYLHQAVPDWPDETEAGDCFGLSLGSYAGASDGC